MRRKVDHIGAEGKDTDPPTARGETTTDDATPGGGPRSPPA